MIAAKEVSMNLTYSYCQDINAHKLTWWRMFLKCSAKVSDASEFIMMDKGIFPELTDISEIYVLCKAKNGDRKKRKNAGMPPHDIYENLVCDLFNRLTGHLNAVWWDPGSASKSGKVIQRPF